MPEKCPSTRQILEGICPKKEEGKRGAMKKVEGEDELLSHISIFEPIH
jgi:hypothetical protein